jgi:hypothetical protein
VRLIDIKGLGASKFEFGEAIGRNATLCRCSSIGGHAPPTTKGAGVLANRHPDMMWPIAFEVQNLF